MDTVLIQLYVTQYGWTAKKIAEILKKPVSYVEQVIIEENLSPPDSLAIVQEADGGQVQTLKDAEVQKQAILAPLYVQAEALLLGRLIESLDSADLVNRIDSHDILRAHANTLQSLKQHAIVNKVIDDKNSGSGVTVNVIGMIQ